MNRRVNEFFEALKHNPELKSEFGSILEMYPEKKVVDDFSAEEQLKFICEVVLPFARNHGFEFGLEDIVLLVHGGYLRLFLLHQNFFFFRYQPIQTIIKILTIVNIRYA